VWFPGAKLACQRSAIHEVAGYGAGIDDFVVSFFLLEEVQMALEATLTGNLLTGPVTKTAPTKEGPKPVVELRVMAAYYREESGEDGNTRYVQDEKKTFPVQVSIWNEQIGVQAMKLLKVGASVTCTGTLFANPYTDGNGNPQAGLSLSANTVKLGLSRVEDVIFREKTTER
jgi:single-strand DNA-binding protein